MITARKEKSVEESTQIVKYTNNGISLDARIEAGQAWLTARQAAELFGVDSDTVGLHARNIIQENELPQTSTEEFSVQLAHGSSSRITKIKHLSQDMVMAIGFRVRSHRGVEYRQWALSVLKGEAEPLAAPKPKTQIQILLGQAQALAALEEQQLEQARQLEEHKAKQLAQGRHQEEQDKRLDSIETALTIVDEPKQLPPAAADVPETSKRKLTVRLVSSSVRWHGGMDKEERSLAFRTKWNEFYADFSDTYGKNLKQRAENRAKETGKACDPLDIAEELGLIEQCYALALKRYPPRRKG